MTEKIPLIPAGVTVYNDPPSDKACPPADRLPANLPARPSHESVDRSSHAHILGLLLCFSAALVDSFSFVTSQLLNGVVGTLQLSFAMYSGTTLYLVCYKLYVRQAPQYIPTSHLGYMLVFLTGGLLYVVFAFEASIHLAVGTINSVLVLSFVLATLCYKITRQLYLRNEIQTRDIVLDVILVILLSIGIIFLAQPTEIFHSIKYFENVHTTSYTSVCNSQRFNVSHTFNRTHLTTSDLYLKESWKGYVFGALAGICNLFLTVSFQKLYEDSRCSDIIFWAGWFGSGVFLLGSVFTGGFVFPQQAFCLLMLGLSFLSSSLLNVLFFTSLCTTRPFDVAVISGFRLPLLFIFQFTVLKSISPAPVNAVAVLAAMLIFVLVVGKPVLETWLAHRGSSK